MKTKHIVNLFAIIPTWKPPFKNMFLKIFSLKKIRSESRPFVTFITLFDLYVNICNIHTNALCTKQTSEMMSNPFDESRYPSLFASRWMLSCLIAHWSNRTFRQCYPYVVVQTPNLMSFVFFFSGCSPRIGLLEQFHVSYPAIAVNR